MHELWNLDPTYRAFAFLVGIALIGMGRRLFWLFVGVAGFLLGLYVAETYLLDIALPPMAIGALAGLAGAVLALFAQKIAVMVAGVVVGASIGTWLLPFLPMATSSWDFLIVIAAAIIGAVAARQFFDMAVTLLSSAVGGLILVEATGLQGLPALFLVGALTAVGWFAQSKKEWLKS